MCIPLHDAARIASAAEGGAEADLIVHCSVCDWPCWLVGRVQYAHVCCVRAAGGLGLLRPCFSQLLLPGNAPVS